MFEIKKNIPIPASRHKKSEFVTFLESMEIGDCAEIPWEKYYNAHSYAKIAGIKIKCRAENEVYRIWRIK